MSVPGRPIMTGGDGPALRGVNYDTGTDYSGTHTRDSWRRADTHQDLVAIRDDLHCTTVNVYGTDLGRLTDTATLALELGLDVWVQPRLIDHSAADVLDHLAEAAGLAEALRIGLPQPGASRLVLNLGCEWSIFTNGIVPGSDHAARAATLANPLSWPAMPLFNHRLAGLLERARKAARDAFGGPITYAAGLWERVDWSGFDIVGVNYYRVRWNRAGFERRLRRRHRHGKPVVITEFGCGSFRGAADLGPQSHTIVETGPTGRRVPAAYARDERVQATYVAELLHSYARAGVHGAFVFEFIEPYQPHSPNPADDLDMTGYALVASQPGPATTSRWRPKAAFHEVARIFEDWAGHQPVDPDRN